MTATIAPELEVIDVAMLESMLRQNPDIRILDVRSGGEFESVHIPGSYNVPLDALGEHVGEFASVKSPVVLICQSGGRATVAQKKLQGAGKDTLHVLEGGMNSWIDQNGEVNRGTDPTWAMDRQVRFAAGVIALVGVLVSVLFPRSKWIAGGIAAGLIYSATTDTCPVTPMFAKLPYNQGDPCDIEGVLSKLER